MKSSNSRVVCAIAKRFYGSQAAERVSGKTVLITGASSGIGRATAYELAKVSQGTVRLILSARRLDRLQKIDSDLRHQFPQIKILPFQLDVANHLSVPKELSKIPDEWAKLDVLINNAGLVLGNEKVGEVSSSDINTMFNTNVLGLIALTQYYVPKFKVQGSGDVVNIGSIAGLDPYAGGSIYCATKAAVRSFTHALRKETIDTRIRIIEIQPGQVETEFSIVRNRGDKTKADAVYVGAEPLTPQDVAEMIVFAITRRQNTVIADTLMFPSHQASASHVYKSN